MRISDMYKTLPFILFSPNIITPSKNTFFFLMGGILKYPPCSLLYCDKTEPGGYLVLIIKQAWLSGTSQKCFVRFFFCQIDYCEWGKWFISHSTRRQWCQWWRWRIRLKVLLQTFCWTWTPIVATKQQRIGEDKLHFYRVWVKFKSST